jgi:hypothetical protein
MHLQFYQLANEDKTFIPNFLEVNSYNSNKGARWNSIIFPPIFMLLVWVYMHDIMWNYKYPVFVSTLLCFSLIGFSKF